LIASTSVGRRLQREVDDRRERLEGVVQQQVAGADASKRCAAWRTRAGIAGANCGNFRSARSTSS
jgi:hypothetical protein